MKKMIGLLFMIILSSYSFCQETLQTVAERGNTFLVPQAEGVSLGVGRSMASGQSSFLGWRHNSGAPYGYIDTYDGGAPFVLQPFTGRVGIGATMPNETLQIGNSNNGYNHKIAIPGMYNFENLKIGQFGNGASAIEFVNHVDMLSSYGIKLTTDVDDALGFQIKYAPVVSSYSQLVYRPGLILTSDGNVGIGTTSPNNTQGWQKVLDLHGDVNAKLLVTSNSVKTGIFSHNIWGAAAGRIGTESAHPLYLMAGYGNDAVAILPNGNVGIGSKEPGSYKLAVEGTIGARKIKVTQEAWADYVFDSSYQLPSLSHVETFIKENKHLPEIPSAAEVKKDGLDLGDNQVVLLKKIEELTLYIIQQNKKMEQMEKRMTEMEAKQSK
ncbi:hypothetical protein [Filimonas effusa]|uniref:Peptidase S74 domain-containing protein n=1 Tax=Filimonas effusa TaxID=2508721 RepID=A0A4Q1D5L1_9BACT|nr:hypothetical protein [Filimonas effusa]RXK82907.1 hypothetical protein ESB13_12320 [Filimonas effusa]